MNVPKIIAILSLCLFATGLFFTINAEQSAEKAPIKVLLITGGGWHDYKTQAVILKNTIESRLNATVDVKWTSTDDHPVEGKDSKIPHIFTTNFAEGYDVVFHNHCHVGFNDDAGIDAAIENHIKNQVGVVLTHGTFHSFMKTPEQAWDRLCGCNSIKHAHKSPLEIKILDKEHPVTKALGVDGWKTKEGELYTTTLNEDTISLAEGTTLKGPKGKNKGNGQGKNKIKTDSCIFTHQLDGCNVMGITLGHHNSTMRQEEYRQLVAYSVLWAAKKLDAAGVPAAGFLKPSEKAAVETAQAEEAMVDTEKPLAEAKGSAVKTEAVMEKAKEAVLETIKQ